MQLENMYSICEKDSYIRKWQHVQLQQTTEHMKASVRAFKCYYCVKLDTHLKTVNHNDVSLWLWIKCWRTQILASVGSVMVQTVKKFIFVKSCDCEYCETGLWRFQNWYNRLDSVGLRNIPISSNVTLFIVNFFFYPETNCCLVLICDLFRLNCFV